MTNAPIACFFDLFRGNEEAYLIHIPEKNSNEGEKAKGRTFIKRAPVTFEQYKGHIEGKESIGISPIISDGKVRFCAIDVDIYPLDPTRYCKLIHKLDLPLVPFRSKSGGLHLYCFFSSPIEASKAIEYMDFFKFLLDLPETTEVFPKQRKTYPGDVGNCINLPYFNVKYGKCNRYAYSPAGESLPFEKAMPWIYSSRKITPSGLDRLADLIPLCSAPPCLQKLFIHNDVYISSGNRNIFLFNIGVYLKARWKDDFENRLERLNNELVRPLDQQELHSTVIKSLQRGSYSYQCSDSTMQQHCNKELCVRRMYGKGSGAVSNFSFGTLTQILTDPPYYKWVVNDKEMVFYSEQDLRMQDRFIDLCLRYLHKIPNKLKADVWTDIINTALKEIVVEKVTLAEDVSASTLWKSYLFEYLTERASAENPEQINLGLVYHDDQGYYFKAENFIRWLEQTKRFREFTLTQIHFQLKSLGITSKVVYSKAGKRGVRSWFCPRAVLASFEQDLDPVEKPDPTENQVADFNFTGKSSCADLSTRSADRLTALLGEIPDTETLDFSDLKEKEEF